MRAPAQVEVTFTDYPRRKWTAEEFEALCSAGILGKEERVELIEGDLIVMTPPGVAHTGLTGHLTTLLALAGGGRFLVYSQSPVDCGPDRPQPDVAVLSASQRSLKHYPRPLLVVEVADSSLAYDRAKRAVYARAGVPEHWLVDVQAERIEVSTEPTAEGRYSAVRALSGEDAVTTALLPALRLTVAQLFRDEG